MHLRIPLIGFGLYLCFKEYMLLKVIRVESRVWSHLNRGMMKTHRRRGSIPHFGVDKGTWEGVEWALSFSQYEKKLFRA